MSLNNESLARVGSAIQLGGMIATMVDGNTTGTDDKIGKIAQDIGSGLVKASTGDIKTAAGLLDAAADALHGVAAEIRAGKAQQ